MNIVETYTKRLERKDVKGFMKILDNVNFAFKSYGDITRNYIDRRCSLGIFEGNGNLVGVTMFGKNIPIEYCNSKNYLQRNLIALRKVYDIAGPKAAALVFVAVPENQRRKGFGTRLIDATVEETKKSFGSPSLSFYLFVDAEINSDLQQKDFWEAYSKKGKHYTQLIRGEIIQDSGKIETLLGGVIHCNSDNYSF